MYFFCMLTTLCLQMGEKDWERLTELQRQRKILKMKKKERRLRREGKMDEINALMGKDLQQIVQLKRLLHRSNFCSDFFFRSFRVKRICLCLWSILFLPLKRQV